MQLNARQECPSCHMRSLPTVEGSETAVACQNQACRTIFSRELQPIGSYSDAGAVYLVPTPSPTVSRP